MLCALRALDVGDEADAAGVVLVGRVVQALRLPASCSSSGDRDCRARPRCMALSDLATGERRRIVHCSNRLKPKLSEGQTPLNDARAPSAIKWGHSHARFDRHGARRGRPAPPGARVAAAASAPRSAAAKRVRAERPTLRRRVPRSRRPSCRSSAALQKLPMRGFTLERRVADGPVQRVVADQRIARQPEVVRARSTTDGPALERDKPGAHRRQFDEADAGLQQWRSASTTVARKRPSHRRAAAAMAAVEAGDVAPPERLHHAAQAAGSSSGVASRWTSLSVSA